MKKILFTFCLLLSFSIFSQEEKRLALVIGNSNYEKGELKNPVNDAKLIAKTLDSLGFDVIDKYNLTTQRELLNTIREFGKQRDSYDVGFVYYAGHGVQVENENFLLPTKEIFESEDDIVDYAVSVQKIMTHLESKSEQVNILVLDACRDNPFESEWVKTRSIASKGLAKIPPPTGSLIAFSTSAGKTADDGLGENSIYTLSLTKNMYLKDTDIDQVFRNVRSEVLKLSNGKQRPAESTQLTGDAFYLVKTNYEKIFDKAQELYENKDFYNALETINEVILNEPNNIRALIVRAKIYNKIKGYDKALSDYEKLILLDPKNPELYFWRTDVHEDLEDYEKAIEDYNISISLDSTYGRYYSARAFSYRKLEDYDKAIIDYDKAIKLDSINPQYYFERGKFYYYWNNDNGKNNIKAIKDYYQAIELNPKKEDYFIELAKVYSDEKKNQKALENFEKAITLNNNSSDAYFHRTTIYENLKQYDKALKDYNKAIELDPNNEEYYYYRARLYANVLEEYDKAIVDFKKAIELDPDYSTYHFQLALLYQNKKEDFDSAIFYYNNVIELDPLEPATYGNIALLYRFEINDYEKSMEYFNKSIEINPDYAWSFLRRGDLHLYLGSYDLALKDFNKAINLDPDNAENYGNRAELYEDKLKRFDEAIEDYKKAIELDPNSIEYPYQLAVLYQNEKEDFNSAIYYYNKCIEIDSTDSDVYTNIGLLYAYQIKNNEKALDYFNQSIETNPNSAYSHSKRGNFYAELEKYENAINDLTKAIELSPKNGYYYSLRGDVYYSAYEQYEDSTDDNRGNLFGSTLEVGYLDAISDYKKAIELDPDDGDYPFMLAILYQNKLSDYDGAINYYNKAIELNPDEPIIYGNIAQLYRVQIKDFRKALEYFNKAIDLDPNSDWSYSRRGLLYKDLKQQNDNENFEDDETRKAKRKKDYYEMALEDFNKAIELNPKDATYFEWKAELFLFNLKKYNDAIINYKKALKLDPDQESEYLFLLTTAYEYKKDYNSAIIYYNKIIDKRLTDFEQAFYHRGVLYSNNLFDFKNAKADFLKYLDLFPESDRTYVQLGNMYLYDNNSISKDKALEYFKKAIEIDPNERNNYFPLINFYINTKNYELALLELSKVFKYDFDDPEGYYKRSLIYLEQEEYLKSYRDITTAISKKTSETEYSISNSDLRENKNIELHDMFIKRAFISKKLNNNDMMCEDYKLATSSYKAININVEENSIENKIDDLILTNCN